LTFYPAVMIVALLAGLWPGVLATALASLVVNFWVVSPHGRFTFASTPDAVSMAFFACMGILMSVVAERYRSSQQRIVTFKRELALQESREQLRQSEKRFET